MRKSGVPVFAIASLAVMEPPGGKQRLVHDGTHEATINDLIRGRNRQRMPTPRERTHLLEYYRGQGAVLFSLLTDIKGAHRLVNIREDEGGMLGCEFEGATYCNTAGALGASPASEWWRRPLGMAARATYATLGPGRPLEPRAYTDDPEALGNRRKGRAAAILAFAPLGASGACPGADGARAHAWGGPAGAVAWWGAVDGR
mgnify:CR=1 FL=1